ncbi:MAG: hypothetical protein ACI9EX_000269 [Oleispira sp.]|jgi:hypothetical protein
MESGQCMKLDDRWIIADGTLNDLPITIHSREDWQESADSGRFPVCIQIAWHSADRNESNGHPSVQEMKKIEVFHHQIQSQFEQGGHTIIAMVITHDGLNQWVIYSDDVEQFKTDLSQLTAPLNGYPIEVVADEDPRWKTFKKVHQVIQ